MESLRARLVLAHLLAATIVVLTERAADSSSSDRSAGYAEVAEALARANEDSDSKIVVFTSSRRASIDPAAKVILSVYFRFRPGFMKLRFRTPPGYAMFQDTKCGIYTLGNESLMADPHELKAAKKFHAEHHTKSVIPFIEACHVNPVHEEYKKHGESLAAVEVEMEMKPGVIGLSQEIGPGNDPQEVWWCFAMHVQLPMISPHTKDNKFMMEHWRPDDKVLSWANTVYFQAEDVLGDWDCMYSEWEGWGNCNARCGVGTARLTRRLLMETPMQPNGAERTACKDVERVVECNTFDCKNPCQLVLPLPQPGVCSSECGGGLKAVRPIWKGDEGSCPSKEDHDAVILEQCNTEPCRVRCKLADTWTVVTPCSEPCGPGTYRMMRQVLEKDKDDTACQPEWREVPCVRSWCTPLTIVRPDRNILPYPGDTYYVGISFKLFFDADELTLEAPAYYKFGEPGDDCWLHDSDLMTVNGCKVGIEETVGKWGRPNCITLLMDGYLPKSNSDRYHFMIPVTNRDCDNNDYRQVLTVDGQPWFAEVCNIPPQYNRWILRFRREMEQEGKSTIEVIEANGYDLHNPKQEPRRHSLPGPKDTFGGTTNENEFISSGENGGSWRARQIFCSPRLPDCPGNKECPEHGVCPPHDELGQNPKLLNYEEMIQGFEYVDDDEEGNDESYDSW